MTYWYRIYGLTFRSALPCPELPKIEHTTRPDITMVILPEVDNSDERRDVHVADIAGVARYRMESARDIMIAPAPGAQASDIRQYLYGIALTSILYQRGESPIHAGALAAGSNAHIFCGQSGAGKSTLMMQLKRLGLPVLCDDVGVIRTGQDGIVRFYPGVPKLKLWKDALAHFGIDSESLQRDLVRFDKFHLPLDGADDDALPLGSVFTLVSSPDIATPDIVSLSGKQVFEVLMRNTYRPRLLKRFGDPAAHTARCLVAARQAAGFEFRRPWDIQKLETSRDVLVRQLDRLTTAGASP